MAHEAQNLLRIIIGNEPPETFGQLFADAFAATFGTKAGDDSEIKIRETSEYDGALTFDRMLSEKNKFDDIIAKENDYKKVLEKTADAKAEYVISGHCLSKTFKTLSDLFATISIFFIKYPLN